MSLVESMLNLIPAVRRRNELQEMAACRAMEARANLAMVRELKARAKALLAPHVFPVSPPRFSRQGVEECSANGACDCSNCVRFVR